MARPKIEWTDTQLRAIMSALATLDRDFPLDNDRFLDALIDEVRMLTGRLYGATTYSRLLRDVAPQIGVSRNPSSRTLQKAIGRAQSLAPTPAAGIAEAGPVVDVLAWRRALEPVVRDALAPMHALLAQQQVRQSAPRLDDDGAGATGDAAAQRLRLQLAEASLADAHARVSRLEEENGHLRREAAQAEARATVSETRIAGLLEELHRTIAASAGGAGALAKVAGQLAGTERFLKSQNDAVRLQASAEADALRRQVTQLRERVDHLLLDNDQYRRTLSSRQPGNR
ncbi:hypothetical protein E2553_37795 [Paraburkholderia dipogonis]|uniref:DNA-binding protein n=1 Tax=Paraburkholderia dipogonis TaxID=1211383 RepID=A0A4Y8MKX6_9BURK|nr:hypothetical protein [Paraburkholderia dipogonis]TFE38136.1 hypothetical protein E2553_37795 [Paraburkholderia dipogonis]